ncbi:hypothetical protein [Haliangium sp.]|uniref:hypothetical protein n=1 Tax=Haliangium sp. TaxID=2663208 RepID=UPI003D10C816
MTTTRSTLLALALAVLSLGLAGSALAQEDGSAYDVRFESVTDNCSGKGYSLDRARLVIATDGDETVLRTGDKLPDMKLKRRRGGKIKAEADVNAATGRRRVKASGRIERGQLELLIIAEIYDAEGAPTCSQSWNVTGTQAKR